MMKSIFFAIVALMFAAVFMQQEQASAQLTDSDAVSSTDEWNYMNRSCSAKLHDQINKEFDAAIFYMQYAAYFAQYQVNLPGFEKFFFNAASEEREHGMKLIDYALMRGQKPIDRNTFTLHYGNQIQRPAPEQGSVALTALRAALAKEQEVTKSIRELIKICEEDHNDYHLVDYLTGEFLEEQHQGQRDLAGKITMLSKMLKTNPNLGEFLFDKQNM
ncbi:ferritin subunit-like [Anopheles nili]|uniref:ferritin subunit-like n=1 Tax=Anopheles nili TaxID=185578 RepID=UPI00237A4665|nr:ferritin subunit-like [Anopheles nili]